MMTSKIQRYQEVLLKQLEDDKCLFPLSEIQKMFRDILPTFSSKKELCTLIRKFGNGWYNFLAECLFLMKSELHILLIPNGIKEEFKSVWIKTEDNSIIMSAWYFNSTRGRCRKMGELFKPDGCECFQLIESFCPCFSIIPGAKIDTCHCLGGISVVKVERIAEMKMVKLKKQIEETTSGINGTDICTEEDDTEIARCLTQWSSRDIGPDEIYINSSPVLSFQGIFPIKNLKIGSLYMNRVLLENNNVYKNMFTYYFSTEKIEWFQSVQADPEKVYAEYCEQ